MVGRPKHLAAVEAARIGRLQIIVPIISAVEWKGMSTPERLTALLGGNLDKILMLVSTPDSRSSETRELVTALIERFAPGASSATTSTERQPGDGSGAGDAAE